ncbi:MAG: NfeD family protein [Hyphomicrobiales bacterium]
MFAQLGDWTWIVIGLALLGLEVLVPGSFFMWLGLAALGVGAVAFFFDASWHVELLLFGVLALAFIIAGRRFFAQRGDESNDTPGLNARAEAFVGREVILEEPLASGIGRVKLGDTLWRVEGDDAPAGTKLMVISARGGTLQVAPVDS